MNIIIQLGASEFFWLITYPKLKTGQMIIVDLRKYTKPMDMAISIGPRGS